MTTTNEELVSDLIAAAKSGDSLRINPARQLVLNRMVLLSEEVQIVSEAQGKPLSTTPPDPEKLPGGVLQDTLVPGTDLGDSGDCGP
jgi:hypothetical protein